MQSTAPTGTRRRLRLLIRLGLWGVALLTTALFCGTVLFFVTRTPPDPVSQWMEARAINALNNPSISIDLAQWEQMWLAGDVRDYAVQGDLVIWPRQADDLLATPIAPVEEVDVTLLALVYDRNGGIVTPDPRPPDPTRTRFADDEWFLYGCQPLDEFPGWWQCTLLLGR